MVSEVCINHLFYGVRCFWQDLSLHFGSTKGIIFSTSTSRCCVPMASVQSGGGIGRAKAAPPQFSDQRKQVCLCTNTKTVDKNLNFCDVNSDVNCISCSWQCPGTSNSTLSATHWIVSLFLCSSAQKAIEGSKTETDFIAGRNGKNSVSLTRGH